MNYDDLEKMIDDLNTKIATAKGRLAYLAAQEEELEAELRKTGLSSWEQLNEKRGELTTQIEQLEKEVMLAIDKAAPLLGSLK